MGSTKRAIDQKLRICLPAWFGLSIGDSIVLMRGKDCLEIWRTEEWENHISLLGNEKLRKDVVANARPATVDTARRVLIPEELASYIQLGKETDAKLVGSETHIEIQKP